MTALRLRYQTIEFGKTDIHLCTLRDRQEYQDPDGVADRLGISSANWSLFGVVWPSSRVLAHYIADYDVEGKRILEVGCGIGLSSLMLNKQDADISATDYHPEAEGFLNRNTLLNGDADINFERLDWANLDGKLGLFDLIIGSDILYEDQHIEQLAQFMVRHANKTCEVVLVDPGRGRKNKLFKRMADFGFEASQVKPDTASYLDEAFKGYILKMVR